MKKINDYSEYIRYIGVAFVTPFILMFYISLVWVVDYLFLKE